MLKIGELCWVFEGCKRSLEEPVIYMGTSTESSVNDRPYHLAVLQHDGKQRAFADYFYTFVRVEDGHIS